MQLHKVIKTYRGRMRKRDFFFPLADIELTLS